MTENKNELSWRVPEYHEHERSQRWYAIAITVLGLMLVYAVLTGNFLFAIILIIVSIIMTVQDKQKAPEVDIAVADSGLRVGGKEYKYSVFKNFWIYYEPSEQKLLFFEFKSAVRPRLSLPLLNKNPLRIRALLLKHLPEDIEKENEPISEQLTRLLKL